MLVLPLIALSRSDGSHGAEWVRVGSVEDVRTRGVVFLPELPGYVVAGRDEREAVGLGHALGRHLSG
jgi:hypothetical protein